MTKASYIEAYRVFITETQRWIKSNGGKSQQEILADYHKNYCRILDTKLREIGWTFSKFQDHKSTPEEHKAAQGLIHSSWPRVGDIVEVDPADLEEVGDPSN